MRLSGPEEFQVKKTISAPRDWQEQFFSCNSSSLCHDGLLWIIFIESQEHVSHLCWTEEKSDLTTAQLTMHYDASSIENGKLRNLPK